jgi:hypothetical protein
VIFNHNNLLFVYTDKYLFDELTSKLLEWDSILAVQPDPEIPDKCLRIIINPRYVLEEIVKEIEELCH